MKCRCLVESIKEWLSPSLNGDHRRSSFLCQHIDIFHSINAAEIDRTHMPLRLHIASKVENPRTILDVQIFQCLLYLILSRKMLMCLSRVHISYGIGATVWVPSN